MSLHTSNILNHIKVYGAENTDEVIKFFSPVYKDGVVENMINELLSKAYLSKNGQELSITEMGELYLTFAPAVTNDSYGGLGDANFEEALKEITKLREEYKEKADTEGPLHLLGITEDELKNRLVMLGGCSKGKSLFNDILKEEGVKFISMETDTKSIAAKLEACVPNNITFDPPLVDHTPLLKEELFDMSDTAKITSKDISKIAPKLKRPRANKGAPKKKGFHSTNKRRR